MDAEKYIGLLQQWVKHKTVHLLGVLLVISKAYTIYWEWSAEEKIKSRTLA